MASSATVIDFLLSQVRDRTKSLAGGTVGFYIAGGSTNDGDKKNVWLDAGGTQVAANPYTLDANGTAQLYASGNYRVVIWDAQGTLVYDWDDVEFQYVGFNPITSSEYASLNAAVSAIGSTATTLIVNDAAVLSDHLTIPATLSIEVPRGGSIGLGAYNLAVNGQFSAGQYTIFSGSGSVTFGAGTLVTAYPQWWGTNTAATIQKAVNSAAAVLDFLNATYTFETSVTPASNQQWIGNGAIFTLPQANQSPAYNMLESTTDIANWSMVGIKMVGNRAYQTTSTSLKSFAMYLRCGMSNVNLDVTVTEFGALAGTNGGGIIIGALSGTNRDITDLTINMIATNNNGVPGCYVNNGGFGIGRNIRISGRCNGSPVTAGAQNCVYVLGDATHPIYGLVVDGLDLDVTGFVDAGVELNYCQGWTISNFNTLIESGGSMDTAILIRSGANDGTINSPVIVKLTGGTLTNGISLSPFANTDTMERVSIQSPSICGVTGKGIAVGGGSRNISILNPNIKGGTAKMATGIEITGCQQVDLNGGLIEFVSVPFVIAVGTGTADRVRNVRINDLGLYDVGQTNDAMFTSNSAAMDVENFHINRCTVFSVSDAPIYFCNFDFAAATGNRVMDCVFPGTLSLFKQDPANVSGYRGHKYTWAQGAVNGGAAFTLTQTGVPWVALGDRVTAISVDKDVTGGGAEVPVINGSVYGTNKVKVEVHNVSGGLLNIAAGNWTVYLERG